MYTSTSSVLRARSFKEYFYNPNGFSAVCSFPPTCCCPPLPLPLPPPVALLIPSPTVRPAPEAVFPTP